MNKHFHADPICPLCNTNLQMDALTAKDAATTVFEVIASDYDELMRNSIAVHSPKPVMAQLDHEDKMKDLRAKFSHAIGQLLK